MCPLPVVSSASTTLPAGSRRMSPSLVSNSTSPVSQSTSIASVDAIQQPLPLLRGQEVDEGLAVVWNKGIEIDKLSDALARSIGDASGDHATIAMADQYNVSQIFEFEDADNVLDVSIEVVFWPRQMRSFAQSRIARC